MASPCREISKSGQQEARCALQAVSVGCAHTREHETDEDPCPIDTARLCMLGIPAARLNKPRFRWHRSGQRPRMAYLTRNPRTRPPVAAVIRWRSSQARRLRGYRDEFA